MSDTGQGREPVDPLAPRRVPGSDPQPPASNGQPPPASAAEPPADAPADPGLELTPPGPGHAAYEGPEPHAEDVTDASAEARSAPVGFSGAWRRRLLRIIPVPHTPLSALVLILGVLFIGALATLGTVHVVDYSESASFCTTCHTMTPQKKAYAAGAHQDVSCGECHVSPGVLGFVKAKLAGTRELYALVTRTYPTPIPAIVHEDLPPTSETCQKCHPLSQIAKEGQPTKLISRTTFADDEKNTRNDLAVLIRPANAGTPNAKSVHWHVLQDVTYTTSDEQRQTIDSVEFRNRKTGEVEQYIAEKKVRQSTNAGLDVARLKAEESTWTMDCVDCHNRVGHDIPSANQAIDQAMAAGQISPDLPYIKRNAVALLTKPYASDDEGKRAISRLSAMYRSKYPLLASEKAMQLSAATRSLESLYDLTVTSEMNTRGGTYAQNLGHQSSPGCFRCHDGAHYKVVKGQLTKETIPSTCDTCHTFPQAEGKPINPENVSASPADWVRLRNLVNVSGSTADAVPIGARPADHIDPLWVFNHRNVAASATLNPSSCSACHQPTYCQNCHDSGAVKVDHYKMLYNHAQSVLDAGSTNACAVCHQPAYCSQCHKDPVLVQTSAKLGDEKGYP